MHSFISNHEIFKVRLIPDILFLMALQCQVQDAFSAIQDKSEAMKVQALTTVCVAKTEL